MHLSVAAASQRRGIRRARAPEFIIGINFRRGEKNARDISYTIVRSSLVRARDARKKPWRFLSKRIRGMSLRGSAAGDTCGPRTRVVLSFCLLSRFDEQI